MCSGTAVIGARDWVCRWFQLELAEGRTVLASPSLQKHPEPHGSARASTALSHTTQRGAGAGRLRAGQWERQGAGASMEAAAPPLEACVSRGPSAPEGCRSLSGRGAEGCRARSGGAPGPQGRAARRSAPCRPRSGSGARARRAAAAAGAGARGRGAGRRVPGNAGPSPALRAAGRPSPLLPPPLGAAPPASPRVGSGGGGHGLAARRGPLGAGQAAPRARRLLAGPVTPRPRARGKLGRAAGGRGRALGQPSARPARCGALGVGTSHSCLLAAFEAPRSGGARVGSVPRCRRAAASCGNEPELSGEGRN